MAKILSFLFLVLISNSYANQACNQNSNASFCTDIVEPVYCIDATEVRSLSCPLNQSGVINETRYYYCTSETWSDWIETSNNCTQNPPTCVSTTETRTLSCANGYEGLITELKASQCSDPYGSPTWTSWSETSNTCKMTLDNQNNVTSPVSVISPINPSEILNTSVTPTITESVIAQAEIVQTFSNALNSTTTESKKEDNKLQDKKDVEIIPGLGMVLRMALLQSPNNLSQPNMVDSYNLEQENNYGIQQGIYMGLIIETDIFDRFNSYSSRRNSDLLRNYDFQQNAFGR